MLTNYINISKTVCSSLLDMSITKQITLFIISCIFVGDFFYNDYFYKIMGRLSILPELVFLFIFNFYLIFYLSYYSIILINRIMRKY
jgi:hypothetical protein